MAALTPVVKKPNPYTSNTVAYDQSLAAIGKEISKHVVGPMPLNKFLDFLPPIEESEKYELTKATKRVCYLNNIKKIEDATDERQMYKPFIVAMAKACSGFVGHDTSQKPVKTFSGGFIKPDFMCYDDDSIVIGSLIANLSEVSIIGEGKLDNADDPFNDKPGEPLLRNTDRANQTLGQMTNYSIAQLGTQFRTHAFSFLLFKKSVRLMRWDRAGVVVSQHTKLRSPFLAEFFVRYYNANPEERGVDTTVETFDGTADLTKEYIFKALKLDEDDPEARVESIKFFKMKISPSDNNYIIGKPIFLGVSSLASRGTRTYKAWCVETKTVVFLKDTWRIFSGSQKPEHMIYEKLKKADVPCIPTVLDSGDIHEQRTKTGDYAQEKWAKNPHPFRTLQHYRLVLKEVGRSLTSFKTLPQALRVIADSLKAHRIAYYQARILHRDISVGNIIIYEDRGLLVDWEMSRDLDDNPGNPNIERIGTWAFQSLEIQTYKIEHTRYHDLESHYLVLCWLVLRHARHGMTGVQLADCLKLVFEDSVEQDGHSTSSYGKKLFIGAGVITVGANFKNKPLVILLKRLGDIFRALYYGIEEPLDPDPTSFNMEEYNVLLRGHTQRLKILKSDDEPEWAENLIMAAASKPEAEWGEADNSPHEIPAPSNTGKRKRTEMDIYNTLHPGQHADFPIEEQEKGEVESDKEENADIDENEMDDIGVGVDQEFEVEQDEEDGGQDEQEEEEQPRRKRRRLDV